MGSAMFNPIVNRKFLRDHINDYAGRDIGTVLIGDEAVNFFLADFHSPTMPFNMANDIAAGLQ